MAISEHVAKKIQSEAKMFKFGAITDDNLGENLRVTIIAAGFDGSTLEGLGESPVLTDGATPVDGVEADTEEIPQDSLLTEESLEELVLVDPDGEEIRPMPTGTSTKPDDKQTPTVVTTEVDPLSILNRR